MEKIEQVDLLSQLFIIKDRSKSLSLSRYNNILFFFF